MFLEGLASIIIFVFFFFNYLLITGLCSHYNSFLIRGEIVASKDLTMGKKRRTEEALILAVPVNILNILERWHDWRILLCKIFRSRETSQPQKTHSEIDRRNDGKKDVLKRYLKRNAHI